MDLLVIGGTRFLGRHCVEAALARGHRVTLLHRGRTGAELFPGVERILAARDGGLDALGPQRRWDAVLDTCGYVPRVVRQSCEWLAQRCGRYAFVSTISVYADPPPGAREDAPLAPLVDPGCEDVAAAYGPLKAACEAEVERVYGARALIVRPGLIVGPHDPTGRFTYWVSRIARGGEVLAPGPATAAIQLIDARDLGAWLVAALERQCSGRYHAVGPEVPLDFGGLLDAVVGFCAAAGLRPATLHWVEAAFLREAGLAPWSDLPLWLGAEPDGVMRLDATACRAAGLQTRPVAATIADTWGWAESPAGRSVPLAGPAPEREAALLHAWQDRGAAGAQP